MEDFTRFAEHVELLAPGAVFETEYLDLEAVQKALEGVACQVWINPETGRVSGQRHVEGRRFGLTHRLRALEVGQGIPVTAIERLNGRKVAQRLGIKVQQSTVRGSRIVMLWRIA